MKERAVADFVGQYVVDPAAGVSDEPRDGRVVMSRRRIVVASDDDRITIPLSAIVDIVVGNVPPDLRDLYDDTVTIAYETDDEGIRTVLVEASSDTTSRFVNVLFKCLLNGTETVVKHPAKVGGRVTNTETTSGKLSIDSGLVTVSTPSADVDIDIETVVDFDRTEGAPDGGDRATLVVMHANGQEVVTTLVSPNSRKKVNLLGRYLRIEYSQVRREIQDIDISEPEKRVLVTVYATGGDIDFTQVLDGNAAQATNVLNSLRDKGVIDESEEGISLTSRGQIIVTQRLEDVNV